ncbi:MAG: ABC transporter substrate binding protein [Desulfobacteraceae bacterium]|jgi:hypothetical protein
MQKRIWEMVVVLVILVFAGNVDARNRIFWLESYHEGYAWTDSLQTAITSTLFGHDVELEIFHMDTKRNKSEKAILASARKAVSLIKDFRPDIVIASDDNASKYVVMPHFKNASLPIVFCGVNNSVDKYKYPYKNVTGIIELDPISSLVFSLSRFKGVHKVGYLAGDTNTSRILYDMYSTQQTRFLCTQYLVTTFNGWKNAFLRAQKEVDILIVGNISAIKGWNDTLAREFVMSQTVIPTGCLLEFLTPYAFIGCIKLPEEQGRWAAQTALRVLNGTPISDIEVARPHEYKLIINNKIADKLGIKLPRSYIKKVARFIN